MFFLSPAYTVYIMFLLLSPCVGTCESARLGNAQRFLSLMVVVRLPGLLPAVKSLVREEVLTRARGIKGYIKHKG